MTEQCSADKIVEAMIAWGVGTNPECYSKIELYDDDTFQCLSIFVKAVFNFSNVFEVEFEQIFSKHCHKNMSPEQFFNFLEPRIKFLGQLKGYFGFILPCCFVREILYRFKSYFGCFHFALLAKTCLVKFLESKIEEFEMYNKWNGILAYCTATNEKFKEFNNREYLLLPSEKSTDGFVLETLSITENTDPDSKSIIESRTDELFCPEKTENDTTDKLNSEDIAVKGASHCNVHISSGINGNESHFDDSFVNITNSSQMCPLSEEFSAISLEADKEKKLDFIDGDYQLNSNDIANLYEEIALLFDDELYKMYDILLPEFKNRIEVLNLIEKCGDEDLLERPYSDVDLRKICKNYTLKSEVTDENSENEINLCNEKHDNGQLKMSLDENLQNTDLVTSANVNF